VEVVDQACWYVALQAPRKARDKAAEQWGTPEQSGRHERTRQHDRQAGEELQP
jgi:hypothetical protein